MYLTSRFRVLVQIIRSRMSRSVPGGRFPDYLSAVKNFQVVCVLSVHWIPPLSSRCWERFRVLHGGALLPILIRKRGHFAGLYVEMLYFGMTLRISLPLTLTANSYIFSDPYCNCCWWHSFRVVLFFLSCLGGRRIKDYVLSRLK